MQLTTEELSRFVGGDLEIQNTNDDYLLRGPIKSIDVEGGSVVVEFDWLAKNDGGPGAPTATWTLEERPQHEINLALARGWDDIGQGRLMVSVIVIWETLVFFPPDGSKLDPARVAGLVTT